MMKIVVGGPPGAGKTTVSLLLSELFTIPIFSIDNSRETLFQQWGYSTEKAEFIFQQEGAFALHGYESEYELMALEHSLTIEESLIIDLSGGVLLQNSGDREQRLQSALREIDLLFLLVPTLSSSQKATRILEDRINARDNGDGYVIKWLRNGGSYLLEKIVNATLVRSEKISAICIDTEEMIEEQIVEALKGFLL